MCGIAGLYSEKKHDLLLDRIASMCDSQAHRGPDGYGYWVDNEAPVALGHRRLSIIDLSEHGRQPMTSKSGRYTITYNGEIYNYRDLREQLKLLGHEFSGSSDTEVLAEAVDQWGVLKTAKKLIGMFAFAVWDSNSESFSLVRDRLGIKPLLYSVSNIGFAFASEISAFNALPDEFIDRSINISALKDFFKYKYVVAPNSINQGISRLTPGSIAVYSTKTKKLNIESYWDAVDVALNSQSSLHQAGYQDQVDDLEQVLLDAIEMRMVADVPLGAFLSGGIDSSIICALMQKISSKPIKTFTIGFSDGEYNEARHAKRIAEHIGSHHHELYLQPYDLLSYIEKMPDIIDEPFADVSLLPTLAVSKMAADHVTVSLSGDGGDELFAGYGHYHRAESLFTKMALSPKFANKMGGSLLSFFSPSYGRRARLAALLTADGFEYFYEAYLSQWQDVKPLINLADEALTTEPEHFRRYGKNMKRAEYMMLRDSRHYMVDDILQKVDAASMHYSLEARVPLLDHRVFEYVWAMPLEYRVYRGVAKAPLKSILSKYVPREMFERPKQGFGVPISSWLRGPLREWCEGILSEESLRATGVLQADVVRKIWSEHVSGQYDRGSYLWSILCMQQWLVSKKLSF